MSTTTTTTTKRTTASKAKAKADASVKAAAAAIVAEADASPAVRLTDQVHAATTVAEAMAAAKAGITFVTEAEADAFAAIVIGRCLIAEAMYAAYRFAVKAADANAEVKAAADLTWSTVAGAAFTGTATTKAGYEALTAGKRPLARSWSALAEDWALYVNAGDGRWRAAYDVSRGDAVATVRGYLTFARQANAEAKREADEKGTPQSRGAVTKAKAAAEVARQAKAKADAKAKRETEAKAAADEALTQATLHPAANVVAGFTLSGRDLTECYDVAKLDQVILTVKAWRDHVAAMTPDEVKAATTAGGADVKAEDVTAAAVSDVASAPVGDAGASTFALADLVAMLANAGVKVTA